MQKDSSFPDGKPVTSFCQFTTAAGPVGRRLFILFALLSLSCFPAKSNAYDVVYDPLNWAENLLQYIQQADQTGIQSAISATESTISQITNVISQYTKYISQLENLVQQATGTIAQKVAFVEGLYSQIMSIPTSFQNAFQSILNIPNNIMNSLSGKGGNWGSYPNSTNPIDRYLSSAVASLQQLLGGMTNTGNTNGSYIGNPNGTPYNPSQYAANLNQALAAQVLKNSNDTNQIIGALQAMAKGATTLQTGQGVSNAAAIQDLAARNEQTNLQAAGNIYEVQNRNALDQYKNTVIAGKEEEGMSNLYGDFNP